MSDDRPRHAAPSPERRSALAAVKAALGRGKAITAGTRAASDNALDMTVMRLRESIRKRCALCSGRDRDGRCTCQLRCPDRDCQAQPELAEDDASIP